MSEGTSTINKKVWSMATVLMNDGVSNQDYLEQLTYLLFLKMIDEYNKPPFEKGIKLPDNCSWDELKSKKGAELFKYYNEMLESLSEEDGMLKEIYSGAINKISTPAMLSKIINMIDGETWTALSSDVKGDIYEGLLQKIAEDTKSGAGQYFTPRPIIDAMVRCIKPEPNKTIVDPCCGSGGFLLLSKEFIENNYDLTEKDKNFLKYNTFRGWEIVPSTYRLCLMNLFMHNISDVDGKSPITRNDALLSDPNERFDYVLTNPPFGKKSTLTITNEDGEQEDEDLVYNRQDFWTTSSNKQFNFVQHIHTLLKSNGKAAVVLPDNVLFEEGSGGLTIRKKLLETTNLHTILRLPTGIFYKQGVKANVLFFDNKPASKDVQTKNIWIYDLRVGMHFTLKKNPIQNTDLDDFVKCYNPENIRDREETWSEENPNGRWRKFTYEFIKNNKYNLDIKWISDDDNLDDVTIEELFSEIQKESENISNIVAKLDALINGE
ncbi:MAG: DNA methyltransferase [Firmicutes bacterium CAG:321_26_22]|jgi:site-specific DNA-methyltransferase (adenine-specific)|nr:MAG: DNA methyltransferase [Firmicutes bacterium CAG:321_26_22]